MNNSSEEIVEEISLNLYKEGNYAVSEIDNFYKLPLPIRDIILVINFDTELAMQGILGFLENSTALFLNDTIETLERIKAHADYKILKKIKLILDDNKITTSNLRDKVNKEELYSIRNFSEIHGSQYDVMANKICELAENLYLYSDDRNIFDHLIKYIDTMRTLLIEEK